jgi:hypothetical protein
MTRSLGIIAGIVLLAVEARGQTTPATPAELVSGPTAAATEETGDRWLFSASAHGYIVPDGRDYVQPTLTADHGRLHLEARYDYEELDTGSTQPIRW